MLENSKKKLGVVIHEFNITPIGGSDVVASLSMGAPAYSQNAIRELPGNLWTVHPIQ